MIEVEVDVKRLEIGTAWVTDQIIWYLYDLYESDHKTVEIWLAVIKKEVFS